MYAVLTADVVASRSVDTQVWLSSLRKELAFFGREPFDWQIYRGDSLQLLLDAELALVAALRLKAALRQESKSLDIRVAIGLGEITHRAEQITESNGEAFMCSGSCFEQLKTATLAIRSPWEEVDRQWNLFCALISEISSSWSSNQAFIIREYLQFPQYTQTELAAKLGKKQSNVSRSLKQAGYDSIREVLSYYQTQIRGKLSTL